MQTHPLSQISLFRCVPNDRLKSIESVSEIFQFKRGEVIFEEGKQAQWAWIIQQGWVFLVKNPPYGSPATIFTVTPAEMLCGFSAVIGKTAYFASAVAATDTVVLRLPRGVLVHLLKHQPGFAEQVLSLYHKRISKMAETVSLAHAPVVQRVAYVLLRLKETFGSTVRITHNELARMAGTRWETSIRTVSKMKKKGWIDSSRGEFTIIESNKLRSLLHDKRQNSQVCK